MAVFKNKRSDHEKTSAFTGTINQFIEDNSSNSLRISLNL